ncbi:MAG: molybdopterin-dependent oxidoreductase [Candidatus Sigynarchaeota archaeon]
MCDASCGLVAVVDKGKVISVLPDKNHPVSKGYCCPKGLALHHVANDPDRVLRPLKYEGGSWQPVSWKQAIGEISARLTEIRDRHGPHAIASHMGTNGGHNFTHSMYWKGFCDALGTKNRYTAGSVDNNNKFAAQYFMYGNSTIMPIPDLPNADFLLLVGTNPAVTNLSLAVCSNVMDKIKAIARRGKVVIIDPRRNETAKVLAGDPGCRFEHHFIEPGSDTWFLMALLNVIITDGLVDHDFIRDHVDGYEAIKPLLAGFTPDLAERRTGIPANTIAAIAREFARTRKATIYGRLGTCIVPFPTVNAWAIEALHAITGHLDREGCAVFGHGPFNVAKVGRLIKLGEFDQWRSRIGNFPSVMGALPLGILAREITTPGKGQVRALVESGGNLALTAPGSVEMQAAMKQLELLVSIDFYRNETATIAAEIARVPAVYILPATTPLEIENIHITHLNYGVVPHVEYHAPVVEPPRPGPRPEWEIFMAISRRMRLVPFGNKVFGTIAKLLRLVHKELDPGFVVSLLAIIGNVIERHPPMLSSQAITFGTIKKRKLIVWKGHRYGAIKEFLLTGDKKVHLAAPEIVNMIRQLDEQRDAGAGNRPGGREIFLIGRRHLKTMNSWLHNIPSLQWDQSYPRLLVNVDDGSRLGLQDGDVVRLSNDAGEIIVPVELTRDIMPGVASYPHGWGHFASGLEFARKHPGDNYNALTDAERLEPVSGMPRLDGIRARIEKKSPRLANPG